MVDLQPQPPRQVNPGQLGCRCMHEESPCRYLRHEKCLIATAAPSINHMWYYLVANLSRGPANISGCMGYLAHPSSWSTDCLPAAIAKSLSRWWRSEISLPVTSSFGVIHLRLPKPDRIAAQHTSLSVRVLGGVEVSVRTIGT
jgi:hypothetical protein